MGLTQAPSHFQWCMESILGDGLPTNVYLDDIGVRGDVLWQIMRDSADAIIKLAEAGAMINMRKTLIAIKEGKLLGDYW
jgi:hypothetical protein